MIDAILRGFAYVVKFCYMIGGNNYLIALILFALIVKIVLLPLGIKQQKNTIKQASLRPKEMAIKKRYAGRDDQVTQKKMQNEIWEMYQKENFNPMGGCLPLLFQLPIFLALYQVVIRPLEFMCDVPKSIVETLMNNDAIKELGIRSQIQLIDLLKNNFSEYASQLEGHVSSAAELPNFSLFGINLANIPTIGNFSPEGWLLLLVPVLTFVCTFFSMRITKKFSYNANADMNQTGAAGCSTKLMDWSMPLLSVYITFVVPAVIGIYWIFNNLFGMIQTLILAKVMPLPTFTEEDYKRVEKEMNGKYKPDKNQSGEKKKVRSLHRIDEEDYEQPEPEQKKPAEQKKGLAGMIEKPEISEDDNDRKKNGEE